MATKSHRAGFGPHCRIIYAGQRRFVNGELRPIYHAVWKAKNALNRDDTLREFLTPDAARAWLAAADVTQGASVRHE